jgi:hypothetical protein
MTSRARGRTIGAMNKQPSPRVTKYVLIPLPRTDARPRRFRLAPVDEVLRLPTVMAGPGDAPKYP